MKKQILMAALAFTLVGCSTGENYATTVSTLDELEGSFLSDSILLKTVEKKTIEYEGIEATYDQDVMMVDLAMDEENLKKLGDNDITNDSTSLEVNYMLTSKGNGTVSINFKGGSEDHGWTATVENDVINEINDQKDEAVSKLTQKIFEILLSNIEYVKE